MPLAIFDIDGTLTDTNEVDAECYSAALEQEIGIALPSEWPTFAEVTDSGILHFLCERAGVKIGPDAEARIVADFGVRLGAAFRSAPERFRPIPGATGVFAAVREAGWSVAVATGGWRPSSVFKLDSAGIPHQGVPLATSTDHPARREIIRIAIERSLPGDAERVVYVGDGVWDGRAAREVGCTFVGVGDAERARALSGVGAVAVLPDFSDAAAVRAALDGALD